MLKYQHIYTIFNKINNLNQMNMNEELFSILASVLPMILFLSLVIYFVIIKRKDTPTIYKTHIPLKLVGVSIKSCDADIERDDALLREKFERLRTIAGIPTPKKTLVVRFYEEENEDLYEYFIGMLGDPNNVPEGFKFIEIPVQTYVMSKQKLAKDSSLLKSITKVKFYIYKKWLPKSEYVLNKDQAIKAIEIHHIDSENPHPEIFVAVKKANNGRYS